MHSSISLMAILATTALAKTIMVTAGKGGLVYNPDTITAAVGDVVEFHFFSSLHTVVQGDFSTPCAQGSFKGSGIASGRVNNKPDGTGSVFQVTIKDTSPIWFYCSTPSHCQSGMAGVINPPSSGNTLDAYKAAAMNTQTSDAASGTMGGVIVAFDGSSSAVPASSSTASATTSSSAAPVVVMSSSSAASVVMSSSMMATSASTMMTMSTMAAASTSAASTAASASVAASAASSATTTKPSQVTTSGAGSTQWSMLRAAGAGTVVSLLMGIWFGVLVA